MKKSKRMKFSLFLLFSLILVCGCRNHDMKSHEETIEENDNHDHEGAFTIDSIQASKFGIEFDTVEPEEFTAVIRTSGEIEASGSDIFTVTARKNGIFYLKEGVNPGITMKKGEVLGTISSTGVQGGDPEKIAALNLEAARKEYERLKPLYEDGLVTASAFNEAERAYLETKASVRSSSGGLATETSPIDGTLTQLFVTSGNYVEVGTPIAVISKNSKLNLRADLPIRYSGLAHSIESANVRPEGSDIAFSIDSLGGKRQGGNSLNGVNGYIPIYFSFSGNPHIFPGGFAEVYLLGNKRKNVISVPKSALVEIQGNRYAYVVHHGHEYEKRLVKTGDNDGIRIEIIEGLYPGEKYVSKGASIARMAETSAIAPPSHSHTH